jgi:hypothetical protein
LEAKTPFATDHQIAGAVAGVLDETSGRGARGAALADAGDGTSFHAAGTFAEDVRHHARGRAALEDLGVHGIAIGIFGNL